MDRRRFVRTGAALSIASAAALGSPVVTRAAARRKSAMSDHFEHVKGLITDWRRKDIDSVLGRVTDDIAWHTHVGSPPVNGKPAMKQMMDALAGQMNDVRWRIFQYAQNGDSVFLEGVDDFVNPEGRRVVLPYAGVLMFRGALISQWRDYFDRGLFNKLKAGEAAPDYIAALTTREPLF